MTNKKTFILQFGQKCEIKSQVRDYKILKTKVIGANNVVNVLENY